MAKLIQLFPFRLEKGHGLNQYTVFRKAYILSGSGFHEFLYSMIESLKKFVKLLSLFLISCVFTKIF